MQGMVGGFRRVVGVEEKKKRGTLDTVLTVLLLLALAGLLLYRFG